MPSSIQHLLEKQTEVLVVPKAAPLSAALDLMSAHAYSQLPVVDEARCLLGLVTSESMLQAIRSFNARPDELLVRFFQTTYGAAADLGGWDRTALDRSDPPKQSR